MSTLEDVRIEYSPLRIGFCVRNDDISDVLNAARLNTLLWGGIFNPIIPVGAPDELDHHLVKLFQVDVLVPIAETQEIKDFLAKYEWARFPRSLHSPSIFSQDIYQRDKKVVNVLDVGQILKKLWEKDFKYLKSNKSNCVLPRWQPGDPTNNVFTLLFGEYPNDDLAFKYEDSYKKTLKAREIGIRARQSVPAVLARTVSPLNLTDHEIKSFGGQQTESGIYVGRKDDFLDLVNFWNTRASGGDVVFLSETELKRFLPYIREQLRWTARSDHVESRRVVHIWFKADHEHDQKTISRLIRPLRTKTTIFVLSNVSIHSWNGMNIVPTRNVLGEATAIASVNIRYGKPRIGIQLIDKPTLKDQGPASRQQYFVVSIRPTVGIEFPEYTTNLPVLPDLNEWYGREMVFDPFSLRTRNGFLGKTVALITEVGTDTIELSPIHKFEVIRKVLERASIKAEKSAPGLIAERLIAIMDGLTGSARVFKIRGVRKLVDETRPLDQKTKHELVDTIKDGDSFKNFEHEFGLNGKMPIEPVDAFATLLEKRLIQAGIEVKCPRCSIKTSELSTGELTDDGFKSDN